MGYGMLKDVKGVITHLFGAICHGYILVINSTAHPSVLFINGITRTEPLIIHC